MEKPISKVTEMLGRPQPKEESLCVDKNGVIIISEGELNISKLIKKALSL